MMKKLTTFAIFVFFSCALINAQNKPKFLFDFDYAQFGYDSTSNYVEFYYSFNQSSMQTVKTDSSTNLEGYLYITIQDTATGKDILNKHWKISQQSEDLPQKSNKSLVGELGFVINKGTYRLIVGGSDTLNSENKKFIKDYLKVKPFISENGISVSDIQLASKILQNSPNKKSIFYKNTYEVTPTPMEIFGENLPVVFYYCEVYSNGNSRKDSVLKLQTIVFNSKKKIVDNKLKTIYNNVSARVEVGAIPVIKLPTDTYTILVSIIDTAEKIRISSYKTFYVYNPKVIPEETAGVKDGGVISSVFGVMSKEECDNLFSKCKYIATGNEISQYSKIDSLKGKRTFLYNFWKSRDPSPATAQNEVYSQFLKRVDESDRKFGALNRPGWKTDRGRVLIKYGEPSEIDRYPNQINTKPYEIWHYNEIEGGVIFVFADLNGFSDYQLVNSTKRGELQDNNWRSRIGQ